MLRQGINEISLNPKYPVGYVYRDGIDTYVYAHAGPDTQLRPAYAVYPNLRMTETGNPVANVAVGDFIVQALAIANVTVDQFKNGKMVVSSGAGYGTQYKIRSNGAAAVGNNYYIYLDSPILVALTAGTDVITMYRTPYHDVRSMRQEIIEVPPIVVRSNYVSWVGVPTRFVTADYYCWLKTWGPTFVVLGAAWGGAPNERMMAIDRDGSFDSIVNLLVLGLQQDQQIGGFLLPATDPGVVCVPAGMGLIMLQISP